MESLGHSDWKNIITPSIEGGTDEFRNVMTKNIMRTALSVIDVLIASAEVNKEREDSRCDTGDAVSTLLFKHVNDASSP